MDTWMSLVKSGDWWGSTWRPTTDHRQARKIMNCRLGIEVLLEDPHSTKYVRCKILPWKYPQHSSRYCSLPSSECSVSPCKKTAVLETSQQIAELLIRPIGIDKARRFVLWKDCGPWSELQDFRLLLEIRCCYSQSHRRRWCLPDDSNLAQLLPTYQEVSI